MERIIAEGATGPGHEYSQTTAGSEEYDLPVLTTVQSIKTLVDSFFLHGVDFAREEGSLIFRKGDDKISLVEKSTVGTNTLSGRIVYYYKAPRSQHMVGIEKQKKRFEFLPEIKLSLADLIGKCGGNLHPSTLLDNVFFHIMTEHPGNKLYLGYAISQPAGEITFSIQGDIPISLGPNPDEENDPYFSSFHQSGMIILTKTTEEFNRKMFLKAATPLTELMDKGWQYHYLIETLCRIKEMEQAAFYAGKLEYIANAIRVKMLGHDKLMSEKSREIQSMAARLAGSMSVYGMNGVISPPYEKMISAIKGRLEDMDGIAQSKTFKYQS